jgi:hypothetical protein
MLNASSSHFDPNVWSGRALQEIFVDLLARPLRSRCDGDHKNALLHGAELGRAAPTPGQRGDDGSAGMPPHCNVDTPPDACSMAMKRLAKGKCR